MLKKYIYRGNLVLPPKSDVVFKAIFGDEQNKDLLAAFLRDVLELHIESGSDLELINTEFPPFDAEGKTSRLDIRAKLRDGQQVNVEIQLSNQENIIPRSITYNSRMFVSQLIKGMDYNRMQPAISLLILDFNLFTNQQKWYNQFKLMNVETGEELSHLVEIVFLEMPKMMKLSRQKRQLTRREQWALFLSTDDEEVLDMLADENKNIGEAVEKLVYVSDDEKLRFQYEMSEKAEFDYYAGLAGAEERGMSKGRKLGTEEGRKLGQAEEQRKIAAALKRKGLDDQLISDTTGLALDIIKKL